MYGPVLGASTTTVGALALPNTGSNQLFTALAVLALVAGLVITVVSIARLMSARTTN